MRAMKASDAVGRPIKHRTRPEYGVGRILEVYEHGPLGPGDGWPLYVSFPNCESDFFEAWCNVKLVEDKS